MKAKEKEELRQSPPTEKMFFDNRIKRKNVLALNEKVAAIREYEKMPVYKRIGRMFHCSPDQIKRIVQQKDSILKAWEQRTRRCQDAKTLDMKVVRVSMLGKAVYEWIRRMMYYKDFQITDGLIQKMALQFKSAMGLQNFFPHQEWCDKFRQTYKIGENDSKLLKIGYAQGYSVQIKDIMKDVLSECTPETVENCGEDDEYDDYDDDERDIKPLTPKDENANDRSIDTVAAKRLTAALQSMSTGAVASATPAVRQMPQLQPIRQLVALPIQTNGTGPQKVLVATPIVSSGHRPGGSPMTMTIIPLTTIAKSQNQPTIAATTPAVVTTASSDRDKQSGIPPPMVAIKQEIKDEPVEELNIKQEFISDDEQDDVDSRSSPPTTQNANTSPNRSLDNDDDVALSNLRRPIQNSNQASTETLPSSKANKTKVSTPAKTAPFLLIKPSSSLSLSPSSSSAATTALPATMPPPPPLTRAPSQSLNRTANKRKHNTDDATRMPPIKSFAEARMHLKLLEDFALVKENYRLIGLITRADEVLRELDGNDDVDVD